MKPYTKYKDSGIKWIGEIPETWVNRKIARSFNLIGSGTTPKADNMEFYTNGDINWVLTGDLKDNTIKVANKKITPEAFEKHSALKMFPPGTLLIAMYGATIGKVGILDIEACTNQACCALAESELIDNRFLFYWLIANREQIINLSYGGGQPNISQEIVKTLIVPSPETIEQKAIVSFLDKKTSEIDETITKKENLIKLLEEERKSFVNNAVTKGLNPKVEMKPSGVDWIGNIPKQWKCIKLMYAAQIVRGGSPRPAGSPLYFNGDFMPWITVAELTKDDEKYITSTTTKLTEEGVKQSRIIEEGTLLLSNSGATLGVPKITNIKGCINDGSVAFLNLHEDVNKDFLYYYLKNLTSWFRVITSGSGQPNLNTDIVKAVKFLVIPPKEQANIVDEIEKVESRTKAMINKIKKEIELLKEYKQALIFEAVTGKIDVRENAKAI